MVMEHMLRYHWSNRRWRKGSGVAPNVTIHSIRMLGADGSGYFSDVLMAVDMFCST